jgi:hypothetical protein
VVRLVIIFLALRNTSQNTEHITFRRLCGLTADIRTVIAVTVLNWGLCSSTYVCPHFTKSLQRQINYTASCCLFHTCLHCWLLGSRAKAIGIILVAAQKIRETLLFVNSWSFGADQNLHTYFSWLCQEHLFVAIAGIGILDFVFGIFISGPRQCRCFLNVNLTF